ncbi:hypothetical protein TI39_contig5921g00003 [Zymoseptoria brevis]|uniref:Uncharacterized protein n=1 Tax=Zymoseptoria brevis TaxID=1047168 RepID=A0A0F4G4Y4_9PEZI|nr:hypothetical protein TI39_contig5921g00003 [Zymoseptoria brevis]
MATTGGRQCRYSKSQRTIAEPILPQTAPKSDPANATRDIEGQSDLDQLVAELKADRDALQLAHDEICAELGAAQGAYVRAWRRTAEGRKSCFVGVVVMIGYSFGMYWFVTRGGQ